MRKTLLAFILALIITSSFSQGVFVPLGGDTYDYIDQLAVKYGKIIPAIHTVDKPYHREEVAKVAETLLLSNLRFDPVTRYKLQYLIDDNAEWLDSMQSATRRPLWKFYREPASFLHYTSKNKDLFDLRVNPMFSFHLGGESQGSRLLFERSAGVEVRGNIKKVFSFYFNATGNSARLPQYVTDKTETFISGGHSTLIYAYLPGQAYWKTYSSKVFAYKDAVDYFDARGYVNAYVLKHLNITFGRDKNFIGDGIRSLFLSDNAAPYLFLKFDLNIWRFKYQSIFAELTDQYYRGADQLLPKKYMAVHHLSLQATNWLNVGLFESVIMERSNGFEFQYLNPIIFYRAVEHALGSPDNELIGGDFKINAANHLSFYGQILLDEFNFAHFFKHDGWWANKWGLQLGAKYIDLFPHFDAQVELNVVRPYTYSHDSTTNYSHYNQPLADPLGAGFYEFILHLHYQPLPKLAFDLKYIGARMGADTLQQPGGIITNFGGDILQYNGGGSNVNSLLGNSLTQGVKTNLNLFQFMTTYQMWHNIYVDMELTYRSMTKYNSANYPTPGGASFIFQAGIRLNMAYKSYLF